MLNSLRTQSFWMKFFAKKVRDLRQNKTRDIDKYNPLLCCLNVMPAECEQSFNNNVYSSHTDYLSAEHSWEWQISSWQNFTLGILNIFTALADNFASCSNTFGYVNLLLCHSQLRLIWGWFLEKVLGVKDDF